MSTFHVLGSSGFVGSAVTRALGAQARGVSTPRVSTRARTLEALLREAEARSAEIVALSEQFGHGDVVVVCSGLPDATGEASDELFGANALLPALVMRAAREAGCRRVVHVSSAVVQGDVAALDSSATWRVSSPYGTSKMLGEQVLLALATEDGPDLVVYRPPSVHHESRRITRALTRLASSPAAMVPRGADGPSPQALLENVASAVAFAAMSSGPVPEIVHHPSEGVTVTTLMQDLSGKRPLRVPRWLARAGDATLKGLGRRVGKLAPHSRRLELLWFGQGQAESWFESAGWRPAAGRERWREMGRNVRGDS